MPNLNQTIKDIKSIKIQGASNICRASIAAWQEYLASWKVRQVGSYLSEAKRIGNLLAKARPDEPLTVNAFKYLNQRLESARKIKNPQIDVPGLKKLTKQYSVDWSALIHENGQRLAFFGAKALKNKETIFTHCHSKTVINVLAKAKADKKKIHVYHDETRPLWQGRITANDLSALGIEGTLVVDSAAAFLVSNFSGDKVKIDKVIIGFDVILPDNSALNKVGSFGIELSAYTSKIPDYLAGSLLKKSTQKMEIELRSRAEVWPGGPKSVNIVNYAFDRIPAQLITGYITEFGIIKPSEVDKYVKKYYPWTLKM